MKVLLYQLDGKIPNLAVMRIASHHRAKGDTVELRHARTVESVNRGFWDDVDLVYASLIFERSKPIAKRLLEIFPAARVGGTGWDLGKPAGERMTLERLGIDAKPDYTDYPGFTHSLGYTQRGCRLSCGFCDIPKAEGRVSFAAKIGDIWRGDPWPRNLLLLDNDFFGQTAWRDRIEEINADKFRVCWNQGFNIRLIGDEEAAAIASTQYYDDQFKARRLYTAFDNKKDEHRLFRNLESLVKYGVRPENILVYMLIGYWDGPRVTESDHYRREKLREFGCMPYPMPYVRTKELVGFQRWVIAFFDVARGTRPAITWRQWVEAGYEPRNLCVTRNNQSDIPGL